jgi:hypothetical protein
MRQGLCSRFCYPFQTTKVDRRHAYHDTSEVDSLALTPAALGSTGHPRSWVVDIVRHGQCSDIASDSCRLRTEKRVLIRIRVERLGGGGRSRRALLESRGLAWPARPVPT